MRIPASYCGVVGLKPSFGLVSTRGVVPLSLRLDHVGPLTRRVADAVIMLAAMAGYDAEWPYARAYQAEDYAHMVDCSLAGIRQRQVERAAQAHCPLATVALEAQPGLVSDPGFMFRLTTVTLDEGATVTWAFADNPGDEKNRFPVTVTKNIPNELLVLGWEGTKGLQTVVEMKLTSAPSRATPSASLIRPIIKFKVSTSAM